MSARIDAVRAALDGISGILLTPFTEGGSLNLASMQRIVDRAVDAGVENFVGAGNTSEFYALDENEALQHVRETVSMVGGRAIVTAGVGRALPVAHRLIDGATAAGADAILLHQPLEPFASPAGTAEYVRELAESTELPVVLYMRNDFFSATQIEDILSPTNVVGVKYAVQDVLKFGEHVRRTRGLGKKWVCGLAEVYAGAFYAVGGRGFTSGLINVAPTLSVAIRDALGSGDLATATTIISRILEFEILRSRNFSGNNVTVVKEALELQGIPVGLVRRPGTPRLGEQERETLRRILTSWNVPSLETA